MSLENKVAIVTGATRGIGRAVAERLGRDGAAVIVNYRAGRDDARQDADAVVEAITAAGGRAAAVAGDVSRSEDVKGLFDAAEEHFGGVDILVNNAAVFAAAPLEYTPEELFDQLIAVNLKSVFFSGQQASSRLRDGGRIVNISAGLPSGGIAFMGAYGATKAGVEVLSRSLAHALGARGITVNAVLPGPTDTDMLSEEARKAQDQIVGATPLGRLGRPADLADVVAFLAGEDSRWVTAQAIAVNGGFQ